MGTNLSQFADAFKDVYGEGEGVMREQQNLKTHLFKDLEVATEVPSQDGVFFPTVMQGNERGGAINETESFKNPGSVLPVKTKILSRLVVWPFEVTGSVMRRSMSNKQAFAKGLDAQQSDNIGRFYSDLERQSLGTGTGQITLANGAGSATTSLVVDDPTGFRKGMYIDVWTALGGTKEVSGIQITAINLSTNTLTLASPQTWSDNSIVAKEDAVLGVTGVDDAKELTGFRAICDTTTYSTTFQNIAVGAHPEWQGNVISAGTSPITHDFLEQAHNRQAVIGDDEADTLLSNFGQARTFKNTELTKTRYEPAKIEAGATVLKWGSLTWLVMHTYPRNEIGLMKKKDIKKYQVKDVHVSDLPGYSLYQIVGRDAIGGYYVYDGNLGVTKRNNQARVIDLTEPTF